MKLGMILFWGITCSVGYSDDTCTPSEWKRECKGTVDRFYDYNDNPGSPKNRFTFIPSTVTCNSSFTYILYCSGKVSAVECSTDGVDDRKSVDCKDCEKEHLGIKGPLCDRIGYMIGGDGGGAFINPNLIGDGNPIDFNFELPLTAASSEFLGVSCESLSMDDRKYYCSLYSDKMSNLGGELSRLCNATRIKYTVPCVIKAEGSRQ